MLRKKGQQVKMESIESMNDENANEPQTVPPTRPVASTDFDQNQCCICFRTYEEDVLEKTEFNWVKCVCERWVHEDCVSEIVLDKNGRKLICPYCVP